MACCVEGKREPQQNVRRLPRLDCTRSQAQERQSGRSVSRPVCVARVQEGRTGHGPHVCLSNATMMGRLPCPPPCAHHATDRWPWGQRTCCWSQSTAKCSTV